MILHNLHKNQKINLNDKKIPGHGSFTTALLMIVFFGGIWFIIFNILSIIFGFIKWIFGGKNKKPIKNRIELDLYGTDRDKYGYDEN